MDIPDQTISAQVKPANFTGIVGELLNLATGAEHLKQARTETETGQKLLAEKNALRELWKNGGREFTNPDGSVNHEKLAPLALKAAPTIGAAHSAEIYGMEQSATAARHSLSNFNAEQLGRASQYLYSLTGEPYQKVLQNLTAIGQQNPALLPAINHIITYHVAPYADNPKELAHQIGVVAKGAEGVAAQAALNQPEGIAVNTGAQQKVINTAPLATDDSGSPLGQGTAIPGTSAINQLSPGERTHVGTSPATGNPYIANISPEGTEMEVRPAREGEQEQKIPWQQLPMEDWHPAWKRHKDAAAAFRKMGDTIKASAEEVAAQQLAGLGAAQKMGMAMATESQRVLNAPGMNTETSGQAYKDVAGAVQSATQAPLQHQANQDIRQILQESRGLSETGTNAPLIAKIGASIGVPMGTDYATNYQLIQHKLAQSTASLASGAGMGTDAARELAAQVTGNTEMTPRALLNVVNTNDALATGNQYYAQGLQNAAKSGPAAVMDFKLKWPWAFDIDAVRLEAAIDNGDREEVLDIEKKYGGEKSPKFLKLLDKNDEMHKLIGIQ